MGVRTYNIDRETLALHVDICLRYVLFATAENVFFDFDGTTTSRNTERRVILKHCFQPIDIYFDKIRVESNRQGRGGKVNSESGFEITFIGEKTTVELLMQF